MFYLNRKLSGFGAFQNAPVIYTILLPAISVRTHQKSVAGASKPGSAKRRTGWSEKRTSVPPLPSTSPCPQRGNVPLTDTIGQKRHATPWTWTNSWRKCDSRLRSLLRFVWLFYPWGPITMLRKGCVMVKVAISGSLPSSWATRCAI